MNCHEFLKKGLPVRFLLRFLFLFILPIFLAIFFLEQAEARVLLLPSLTVSEEYNDNFFFTSPHKEEELATAINPALTLRYESPAVILAIIYTGGLRLQLKNEMPEEYTQRLNFNLALPLLAGTVDGVDIRITELFDHTPEIPSVPLGGQTRETFGTGLGRINTSRNLASIGVGYPWSPRFRTDLTYLNTVVLYEGDLPEDSFSHNGDIRGSYNLSQTAQGTLDYGVRVTRFRFSKGFTEQRMTVGATNQITATFFARGSIGGSLLSENRTALISDIGFTKQIEQVAVTGGYVRRVTTAGDIARPTSTPAVSSQALTQTLSAGMSYPMNTTTTFALTVNYTQTDGLSDLLIKTNTRTISASASHTFFPWLVGAVRYAYLNFQNERIMIQDISSNRVLFSLTASDPGLRLMR